VTTDDHAPPEQAVDALATLRLEVWAARDAVIGAEAAAGQLRAKVRALESALDDRNRHLEALLAEVAALRERIAALEVVEEHRDAMLRSPTWRLGVVMMKPVQAVRRRRPE
jgi:hypothetical protein